MMTVNDISVEALTRTPTNEEGFVGETSLVLNGNEFRLYWFGSLDEIERPMSSEPVLGDSEPGVAPKSERMIGRLTRNP